MNVPFPKYTHSACCALATLLLGACGGGGDGGSAAPTPPAPTPAQIASSNYLDAFWVGAYGVLRTGDALEIIDNAFTNVFRAGDVAQVYNCAGGGTLTLTRSGSVRNVTFSNCAIDQIVYTSGTISSADAAPITSAGITYLGSGEFTLTSVVYRIVAGEALTQTMSGSLTFLRRPDRTVQLSGAFDVLRNARADRYSALLATFAPRDLPVTPTVNTGSFSVSTPRFAAATLSVSGNGTGLTAIAPDQSRVRGLATSQGSLATVAYEVTSPGASTPAVSTTLATSDGVVQAAIARVLQ
jgi:hypothetical protein